MGIDIAGVGAVADFGQTIVDKFFPDKMSGAEKAEAQLKIQALAQARDNVRDTANKEVMVAELNQGDKYTKRARPSIVYGGLFFIALTEVVFPMAAWCVEVACIVGGLPKDTIPDLPDLTLPVAFWGTWGSVCGVYGIGRTVEKVKSGQAGPVLAKAIKLITGN